MHTISLTGRRCIAQVLAALSAGALLLLIAPPSHQGFASPERDITGIAEVIDGDTISIEGQRIRLEGIDAPELSQTCLRANGAEIAAGRTSRRALMRAVEAEPLRCIPHGRDGYQRVIATCWAGSRNINEAMVVLGHAWAFRKYSDSYVRQEDQARLAGRGVWSADCEPAWDYRQNRWLDGASAAPDGCAIKGNISRSGKIYHMPWNAWYGRVNIDPERGERWFCSEAEAQSAGWRAAQS